MSRSCTTAALILTSLLATACRTTTTGAFLTTGFVDGDPATRPIIIPEPEDDEYRFYYSLEQKDQDRFCALTARIPLETLMYFYQSCEGISGTGRLSCNDGQLLNLEWTMTSCHGGYGRSVEFAGSTFHFGFETTKPGALAQFSKARTESTRPEENRRHTVPELLWRTH